MGKKMILKRILEELSQNADYIREEELEQMAEKIAEADSIFVAGAGRSGFVARAFSNRLMHLGLQVYFVGEPTTPAIRSGELLIILSGSGETESLKVMAQKALSVDASVAVLTIHPEGSIGQMAECIIKIPGTTPKSSRAGMVSSVQPMGNAFEQMAWLVCDNIVMILMDKLGRTAKEMFALHANLE